MGARGLMASRRKRREKNPLRQRSVVGAASSKRAKQLGPLGCNAGHSPEQIPSSPFCFRRSAAAAAAGDLGAGGKERTENPPSPSSTDGVPPSPAAHVRARTDGIAWINSSPRGSRGACAIFTRIEPRSGGDEIPFFSCVWAFSARGPLTRRSRARPVPPGPLRPTAARAAPRGGTTWAQRQRSAHPSR